MKFQSLLVGLLLSCLLWSCKHKLPKPNYLSDIKVVNGLYKGFTGKVVGEKLDVVDSRHYECFIVDFYYPKERHTIPKHWTITVAPTQIPTIIRDTIQVHDTIVFIEDCEEHVEEEWMK